VALIYDAANKQWISNPEKIDFQADRPTGKYVYQIVNDIQARGGTVIRQVIAYSTSPTKIVPGSRGGVIALTDDNKTFSGVTGVNTIWIDGNTQKDDLAAPQGVRGNTWWDNLVGNEQPTWSYNAQSNADDANSNKLNAAKNKFYDQVVNVINGAKQGSYNYLQAKQAISNLKQTLIDGGLPDASGETLKDWEKYDQAFRTLYKDPTNKTAKDVWDSRPSDYVRPADRVNTVLDNLIGPQTGQFRNFYLTERQPPRWDPAVLSGNLNNRGDIDQNKFNKYKDNRPGYYINETPQGKAAKIAWATAQANDDLDTIQRYGSLENFAYADYLNQITDPTKLSKDILAIRGSEATPLPEGITGYKEEVLHLPGDPRTPQEVRDDVQNQLLGLEEVQTPEGTISYQFRDLNKKFSDLVSKDSRFNKLWTDAKNEAQLAKLINTSTPGPWTKLIKSFGIGPSMLTDQASFGSLLGRIATLDANKATDKNIIDNNSQLVDTVVGLKSNETFQNLLSSVPEVNSAFKAVITEAEKEQSKKFGELRQSVLQDAINELKLAKQKELNFDFFKSTDVGKDLSALQQEFSNSLLGDLSVGGLNPFGQSQQTLQKKLDLGLGNVFGTQNGLLYNWEDWFNNQIEKKYAGNIDVPNDYVPPALRTLSNGFVDDKKLTSWKKYDDAYAALKTNPNDSWSKAIVAGAPIDYVSVDNRKAVKPEWSNYESQLKAAGYVDPKTLASWGQYDQAYKTLQANPSDKAAQDTWNSRPADYILPDNRMDKDVQFAKDFFSTYLKPRFDASQSISEFQDYINVSEKTQNPFQTQDRTDALKLAAQSSVSQWFTNLQKAGDSKFNADYYFDPVGYLTTKGVGDPDNPLLPAAAFTGTGTGDKPNWYANTVAGIKAAQQSAKASADWEAAKQGQSTTDDYGKTINWLKEAYDYGLDVNDKEAFAKLHYNLVGVNAPQKDANGNIVRNEDGTPKTSAYDAAPNVYAPEIAKTYINHVLTPYLLDQSNKIGTVFGQFVKPSDYVDEILKTVSLPENKDQWNALIKNYGIDPNESLSEIKNTLTTALSQDSTTDIKKRIGDLITTGKTPTQAELGVEYIQRATPASGTVTPASGIYAVFKNAGFNGTESDFYSTFLPDASQEDLSVLNAAYTPAGKATPLLPTITGGGMEQIATMAQLFGDTSIQEVLGTAGVAVPSGKPSLLGGLLSASGEDVGIGDPFADTSTPFATVSGTSKADNKIGISNPFDTVGITDPFADESDPFASSNPFSSIGSSSSVGTPKIKTNVNVFTQGFSSRKNSSIGSLFDSFGGSFGF